LLLEIKEYLIRQLLLQMKSWMQLFIVISVLRGPSGGPICAFWREKNPFWRRRRSTWKKV